MSDNLSFLLTCAAECLNNWGYDGHGKHVDDGVKEITRLRAENEKLRAALKPFKEIHDKCLAAFPEIEDADELHFSVADFAHLRAAAAAIRESEAKP